MFTAAAKLWQYRLGPQQTESMVGREGRRTTHNSVSCFTLTAAAALVSSCGGGGGGDSTPGGPGGPISGSPPALTATAFSVTEDSSLSGQVTASDPENQTLTFERISDPASGTVTSFDNASGTFVYQPNANFAGSDTFRVRVKDAGNNVIEGNVTITVTGTNDDPVAFNDVMSAEPATLSSLNVRANDQDPDADQLTVTIEEQGANVGTVGTAAVDTTTNTIRINDLPAGFRGVTRFKYRVTDASGAFSVATAAVFIGTEPFRVTFVGSEAAGSAEIYMTDFVATWRVSAATEGDMRLRGFLASDNGATVVYRRGNNNDANTDLSFVRTVSTDAQVRIALPNGQRLLADDAATDPYAVSPDGQWIAVLARNASSGALGVYLLNVNEPGTLRNVAPTGALYATLPRFSSDSSRLYFLASDTSDGVARKSLYRAAVSGTGGAELLSVPYVAGSGDDITSYSVAQNQARVAVQAARGGRAGIFFIDTSQPRTELPIHHVLASDESIINSTVSLQPGNGGSSDLIAYTIRKASFGGIFTTHLVYLARVEPVANNAQAVAGSSERGAIAFSADNSALLVSFSGGQVSEVVLNSGAAATPVGAGSFGLHDSTRGAVILVRPQGGGEALFSALRDGSSFGTARQMGTPGLAALSYEFTGAPRGVALIGEPSGSGVPNSARFALVNAWAPNRRLELGTFDSPVGLTSAHARVVTY